MATIESNIERVLMNRVGTLALVPPLPIAWPNFDFPGKTSAGVKKPMPASYIRVDHFPNKNTRMFLGSADPHWRQGFIQLIVVTPPNLGSLAATDIAGKIAEHFPADLTLYSEGIKVTISRAPDIAPVIETDISWDVPVTVYYEASA